MAKKVLIIGGVAAGTKVAAKFKREDRDAEVLLLTRDRDISYAGCALPYFVGGAIEDPADLIVNTPKKYAALTGVDVRTGIEATALNSAAKTVTGKDIYTGEQKEYAYDALVIATGARAILPPIPGIENAGVYKMRAPEDAIAMREYIRQNDVRRAVVVGGGFIGLEVAENLKAQGIATTVIDFAPQVLPGIFDPEMAGYVQRHLKKEGIAVHTATKAEEILGEGEVRGIVTSAGKLPCELVVLCVGIRPNTEFLQDSGIEMERGCIKVDERLRTNLPDVYAAGDCAMVFNRITKRAQWSPMGSSANMEGRTLAQILAGEEKRYPGVLGTGVVKLPNLNCARTGLTEQQAKDAGYDVETVVAATDDKAHYYPDAAFFFTKLIAEKSTHKLLGAQILGPGAVDKMADIAVMALNMGAKLEDFENADFAYAPPFSTAIHPMVQAAYILLNKLNGQMASMPPAEYAAGAAEGYRIIDAGAAEGIPGATVVDFTKVDGEIPGIGKEEKLLLVCSRAKRAYFLQNRMRHYGYKNTLVLEGATGFQEVRVPGAERKLSAEDIAKVKALGFLQDKTRPGMFNGRVITRNGKITAQESRAIAEAAQRYGDGEITMTARLTIEIQGVPYENIEPLREELGKAGLETGGTGSKVRPVVSCKGTTCQYGLIDTFALSKEIHERFYHGYGDVKLPHKFKIAVGGCPNNCVKPDLNDIGVIGQRVPGIDLEKCRGCKKCQVESACPMGVAKVTEGKIVIDRTGCNNCGRCIKACPFGALSAERTGYRVYIGGRWGKKIAQGRPLEKVFGSEEEALAVVEKAILLFREQGQTGERFADTVARLGFDNVQDQLLAQGLLERKEDNLTAKKHLKGGATC